MGGLGAEEGCDLNCTEQDPSGCGVGEQTTEVKEEQRPAMSLLQ